MTKKHFIALADAIRIHNRHSNKADQFSRAQLDAIADALQQQDSHFLRGRWLGYILGECGPNGGSVK